jgi:hypothetical protein
MKETNKAKSAAAADNQAVPVLCSAGDNILALQFKEARNCLLEPYAGKSPSTISKSVSSWNND